MKAASIFATALLVCAASTAAFPAEAPAHDLMPVPARIAWQPGRLSLHDGLVLTRRGAADPRIDAALRRTAERLTLLGLPRAAGSRAVVLTVESAGPGRSVQALDEDESYTLSVTPAGARLAAPNPLGVLRGLETFLQLVRAEDGRLQVPAVAIEDRPRFPWRGLLLDCCRHFMPLPVVKRNLDALAAVKMNVFHWHLTEDQAFRIESRRFPRLHQQGSGGQFYTQDQVREVIAYARERGIRVVPEFDLPGHTGAWLLGHPELAASPGPFEPIRKWGIFDVSLDPSREEVYAFLEEFLTEMAELFPDEYIHIGGDEVRGRDWNENPRIQEFLYAHGLRDNHALQAYFNRRLGAVLGRRGKKMVGWDEILHPDLPKGTVVQSWRGAASLGKAAEAGFDGLLSHGYYLDHMQTAAFHYEVDPLPLDAKLPSATQARVLGGEACMWSEFVSPENLDSRIWPRAAAVAERLWSPAETRDVPDFHRRLGRQSQRLEALGLTHRASYLPMLERLAGRHPVASLRVLADVVEPVKVYLRQNLRLYTTETPLDRLVDTVRPESDSARAFRQAVDRFLAAAPAFGSEAAIRVPLVTWRDNHDALEPMVAASPKLAEVRSLSRDLSAAGSLGLEALDSIGASKPPSSEWVERAERLLSAARTPRGELEIAVEPALRKLVLAATRLDRLKDQPAAAWLAELAATVEAARKKP